MLKNNIKNILIIGIIVVILLFLIYKDEKFTSKDKEADNIGFYILVGVGIIFGLYVGRKFVNGIRNAPPKAKTYMHKFNNDNED